MVQLTSIPLSQDSVVHWIMTKRIAKVVTFSSKTFFKIKHYITNLTFCMFTFVYLLQIIAFGILHEL